MDWQTFENILVSRGAFNPCPFCGFAEKPTWIKSDQQLALITLGPNNEPQLDEAIVCMALMCANCCALRLHPPQFFGEPYRATKNGG